MVIKKNKLFSKTYFSLFFILLLGLFLRLYLLDEIPGEIWGDIVVGFDYTKSVLAGRFPLYYICADGPLFFYLVALFSLVFGLSFYTFKLATVFLGIVLIFLVFNLVKEMLGDEKAALISAFLVAVSKWPLVYSRLGNLQIIVPVLTVLSFLVFFRAIKTEKIGYFIISGILAGLSMFSHPGSFTIPLTIGVCYLYWFFRRRPDFWSTVKKFLVSFLVALIVFSPMGRQFLKQKDSFFGPHSYFGEKFFLPDGSIRNDWPGRLLGNFGRAMLAFHVKGDVVFRENPTFDPHLDRLSGLFFLLGIFWWLIRKRKVPSFYVFFPFFFLQLQMILVINYPINVPSAGRSIAIMPFVLILTASGIWASYQYLLKKMKRLISFFLLAVILLIISILNFERYFFAYAKGLPNHNTPFAKIIAKEIDKLPKGVNVYVVGCCWGDWAQPEPGGITYALKAQRKITFLPEKTVINLDFKQRFYVVFPPKDERIADEIKNKIGGKVEKFVSAYREPIFIAYWNF